MFKKIIKSYQGEAQNLAPGVVEYLPKWLIKSLCNILREPIRLKMGTKTSKSIDADSVEIEDHIIKHSAGNLRVREYLPGGNQPKPLLIYCHGGGWVGGSIEVVNEFCKVLSERAQCVVISVDYRLAPEHRFPLGLNDIWTALNWAVENYKTKIDHSNVIVGGDSAGGNLAAVVAQMAKCTNSFKISKQILLYPITNRTDAWLEDTSKSHRVLLSYVLELYADKEHWDDYRISPIQNPDLGDLPKALFAIGMHDELQLHSYKYAYALSEAGNEVTFIEFLNTNHAFIDLIGCQPQAEDLIDELVRFIYQ